MQSPRLRFARAYANSAWVRLAVVSTVAALGALMGIFERYFPGVVPAPLALVSIVGVAALFTWLVVE